MSPHRVLDLPLYALLDRKENETDILFTVHVPLDETNVPYCTNCGSVNEFYGHGVRYKRFHDIPHLGKHVTLQVAMQRFRCRACGKPFTQELPLLNHKHRMTNRLVAWISKQILKPRTFSDVAREVGINDKTVHNVFAAHVEWREGMREVMTPTMLGIDDVKLDGEMRTVLVNLGDHTVFELLETDDSDFVQGWLLRMPDREKVEVVAMDMSSGFRKAVLGALPQATIVIDRFHIVKRANEAMENVRKAIRASLTNSRQRAALVGDRKLLTMRRERLLREVDEMDRLRKVETWFSRYPQLKDAYELKEAIMDIWDLTDRHEAEARWDELRASIPKGLRQPFRIMTSPMQNWREFIFNYFDHRWTNGPTEAVNRTIKEMAAAGRNYSFKVIRAKALFTVAGKEVPPFGKRIPKAWLYHALPEEMGTEEMARQLNVGMDAGPELSTIEAMFREMNRHGVSTTKSE